MTNDITLNYYSITKSGPDYTFNLLYVISALSITSITVKSQANIDVQAYTPPEITLLGIQPRTCQLTASFGKKSSPWITGTRISEITDTTYIQIDHALSINTDDNNQVPELHYGKWIINKFGWNRTAQKMGFWEFDMTLTYYVAPNVDEFMWRGLKIE